MPVDAEARLAALEHDNRRLHAIASAQEFAIEILLTNFMAGLSKADREGFATDVIRVGSKTDNLRAEDDATAELLADIAVQSNEHLARLLGKALARVSAG